MKCTGQKYALSGDETCQSCSFPYMVRNEDNWCTLLWFVLCVLAFVLAVLLFVAIFGRLRLSCLKRRITAMVEGKNWQELYAAKTSVREYGMWKNTAKGILATSRAKVKAESCALGISLQYAFEELEQVYQEKAQQAEWRWNGWPSTRSGYLVYARNSEVSANDAITAWTRMSTCDRGKRSDVGPFALGKDQCCPRDGRADCSVVDALRSQGQSGRATWFMSWAWSYQFATVIKALKRWWAKHQIVSGDGCSASSIYIWWCVFVNNQFRMLEEGITEDPGDLFEVFGGRLTDIGRMLMCMDKLRDGGWAIYLWQNFFCDGAW
ncbi:GIP [Symbiodinium pilosum]|uniref:GIP protein n=1 Tax=Symbiodinium pilosum TaxID=2952 RepID=A0A812KN69_SYMPI|nr:GIP [Symbiodinium pilosum]